jgi:hypothetical protein
MHPIHTSQPYSHKILLIISSHLRLRLQSVIIPWGFPTKNCTHFSSETCILHALPISSPLITPNNICWRGWLLSINHVSHPYKRKDNIFLHILIFACSVHNCKHMSHVLKP